MRMVRGRLIAAMVIDLPCRVGASGGREWWGLRAVQISHTVGLWAFGGDSGRKSRPPHATARRVEEVLSGILVFSETQKGRVRENSGRMPNLTLGACLSGLKSAPAKGVGVIASEVRILPLPRREYGRAADCSGLENRMR